MTSVQRISQSKWSTSPNDISPNDPSPIDPSPINPSLNDSGPNDRTVHCISLQLHVDPFEHETSLWTLNLYKCLTNKLISNVLNIYSDCRGQVRFPRHKYFLYGNISGSRRCFSSSFHWHLSGRTVNHDPFKNSLNEAASPQHCFNISRFFSRIPSSFHLAVPTKASQ